MQVVKKFVDRPGFDQHTVVPRDFVDFMVDANRRHMHPPNTGGRAFCYEYGYTPSRATMSLAALSLGESAHTVETSPATLGAAIVHPKGEKTISDADFLEYQRLKAAQPALSTAVYYQAAAT